MAYVTAEIAEKIHTILENCSTDVVDYETAADDINALLFPTKSAPKLNAEKTETEVNAVK